MMQAEYLAVDEPGGLVTSIVILMRCRRRHIVFPYTTLFRSAPVRELERTALHRSRRARRIAPGRSEEHTSELQSRSDLVRRLLLEKQNAKVSELLDAVADDAHRSQHFLDEVHMLHAQMQRMH